MRETKPLERSAIQTISNFLYARPRLVLALLLGPPMIWMIGIYISSLLTMLLQSFFRLDDFTGQVVREFTLSTYAQLFTASNLDIVRRTTSMAFVVTAATLIIGFPLAYYMARFANRRVKALLYLSVTLPLWSSYLVKVYAWKLILAREGIISWLITQLHLDAPMNWLLGLPGLGGPSLSISPIGIFLVFVYVWLPYMVLPVQAALERVPKSLLEASGDLGAKPGRTFRHVVLPLAFPGMIAGSLFTFSLTLGDFIVPSVMGNSSFFIGQAVFSHQGTSGNIPLAAAMTSVPMVIMAVYLLIARKLGAFEAL